MGPLVPGIFDKIQKYNIEHIYASFPEGRLRKESVEIGGKDAEELIREVRKKNVSISSYAEDMMKSRDFTTQKKSESEILIRPKVGDLGFPEGKYPTTDEIYRRIEELGLELCPAGNRTALLPPAYGSAIERMGLHRHEADTRPRWPPACLRRGARWRRLVVERPLGGSGRRVGSRRRVRVPSPQVGKLRVLVSFV